MPVSRINAISSAIFGIYRLLIVVVFILTIYFAQTIVIPLTVAALLTFLLSPIVIKLEKWIGRIFAILLVVLVVFSIIGFTGYVFAKQLVLFGSNFQTYYEILETKFQAIQMSHDGVLNRIGHAIGNFKETVLGNIYTDVKLIDLSSTFTSFIQSFFGSFFNLLAMTGIVFLLVIFMLLSREDIRGRIIKLIGQSKISSTTSAMNEASERVYIYLSRFFVVNVGFGVFVILGLYLIGIPNPILWGCLAAILRFIPYIGVWIAVVIPIALSFIVSSSWLVPVATISFFILLEFITAYAVEPFYYGVGTGVSSFALIVAAIFWTWLWGSIGLLLSTPLTVCLVVLGQYVSNMNFLRVLLSKEQALTTAEENYHRLLSFDSNEAMDLIESYLQKNSLVSLYDEVLIPNIVQTEKDFRLELIDLEQKDDIYQSIREIIEFLTPNEVSSTETKGKILCIPEQAIRDEVGVSILNQLLNLNSFDSQHTSILKLNEIFELIDKQNPDIFCIVAVAPIILSKMRFFCARIHQHKPQLPIVLCLLGVPKVDPEIIEKLHSIGSTKVVISLAEALDTLQKKL